MSEEMTVTGSSLRSFAEAAEAAFRKVPGDPRREGSAAADVTRLWVTKGGIVGATQYHVELRRLSGPGG